VVLLPFSNMSVYSHCFNDLWAMGIVIQTYSIILRLLRIFSCLLTLFHPEKKKKF
jgi:hypothetical protein